jgi:hypothetical protein
MKNHGTKTHVIRIFKLKCNKRRITFILINDLLSFHEPMGIENDSILQ